MSLGYVSFTLESMGFTTLTGTPPGPTGLRVADNNDEIVTILKGGITNLTKQGSPNKMRDYLATNNIAGRRGSVRDCVLARYFNSLLNEHDITMTTKVNGISVIAIEKRDCLVCSEAVALPFDISKLIARFDHGGYPELDAEIQALLDAEQRKTQLVNA